MEIVWIDVDKCHPNDFNPNVMNPEKFEALCDFMRNHTAEEVDPIWVRRGKDCFEIVDGEHRWKAARAVGWKRLRAFVVDLDEDGARAFNVRKNRERGDLDAFKLGRIFMAEREKGAKIEEIAKKYGYFTKNGSSSSISEIMDCAEYENQIRQKLNVDASTRISIYKAIKVLRELKRQEQGEKTPKKEAPKEPMFDLKSFAERMALAAANTSGKKTVKKDTFKEITDYFKELLKDVRKCPHCGSKHPSLKWGCCNHEF